MDLVCSQYGITTEEAEVETAAVAEAVASEEVMAVVAGNPFVVGKWMR